MKLLHSNGVPIGIYFRKHHQNPNSFVIRVAGGTGQTTDIGADPNNLPECYEKAIDKRLELLGIPEDAEAWQLLASAYGAFLIHYGIEFKTVTHYEFNIKENTK